MWHQAGPRPARGARAQEGGGPSHLRHAVCLPGEGQEDRDDDDEDEDDDDDNDDAQGLAVLSAVSIIYLSVIIYLPAKRELESGIGETPVMCTTVEDRRIDNDMELCK